MCVLPKYFTKIVRLLLAAVRINVLNEKWFQGH